MLIFENTIIQDSQGKGNTFNNYFICNFNRGSYTPPVDSGFTNGNLNMISITKDEIYDVLCKLNSDKVYVCDGVSPLILKKMC